MAVWPSSLQSLVNTEAFSLKLGDTAVRTSMDVGPVKVRRRTTAPIDNFTVSINLTTADYTTLYNFYNTTLNGGVNTFTFNHPITGTSTTFRFTAAPDIAHLGGGTFRASMSWETIP